MKYFDLFRGGGLRRIAPDKILKFWVQACTRKIAT